MRQTPILDKSFPADAAIAGPNLALVYSTANPGNVMLPAGAQALAFAGISMEPSGNDVTNALTVRVAGIGQVQSDGSAVITAGDDIEIATATGQVRTATVGAPAVPGTQANWHKRQLIGKAMNSVAATVGLLVDVMIAPSVYMGN